MLPIMLVLPTHNVDEDASLFSHICASKCVSLVQRAFTSLSRNTDPGCGDLHAFYFYMGTCAVVCWGSPSSFFCAFVVRSAISGDSPGSCGFALAKLIIYAVLEPKRFGKQAAFEHVLVVSHISFFLFKA